MTDTSVGFCLNSKRWVDFMLPVPPKSCPYLDMMGESHCVDHSCGYYEERELTAGYRRKVAEIKEAYGE